MPWVEATLRGQKVYARARSDGAFDAQDGRVEIRYRKTDPRAYRAAAGNLLRVTGTELLDDDACVAGEAVTSAAAAVSSGSSPSATGSHKRPKTQKRDKASVDRAHHAHESARAAGAWIAYTDGACSGNPGPAGAGLVVIAPDGKIREAYRWLGTGTNNVAELTAILLALEALPDDAPHAVIHTDSQYAIGVLTKGWKAKANQELIAKIKRALEPHRHRVKFVYVPGHAGVPMNERADELAREAIRTAQSLPLS